MMSWWDREVSIWTFPRHASTKMAREAPPVRGRSDGGKLVAKILIQVSSALELSLTTINDRLIRVKSP